MRKHYSKKDVQIHYGGYVHSGPGVPSVNVKVYNLPSYAKIAEHFKCSAEVAGKALGFAWESACEQFWHDWTAKSTDWDNGNDGSTEYASFPGHTITVNSGGRSGGWLEVSGLPPIGEWDAVMLARWRKFERAVLGDVAYRTSFDRLCADIEANEWTREGSELYNFCETKTGPRLIADLNSVLAEITRRFRSGEPYKPTGFASDVAAELWPGYAAEMTNAAATADSDEAD